MVFSILLKLTDHSNASRSIGVISSFIFIFILFISPAHSQFGPEQIISNQVFGPIWVASSDLDNDGFMDIVSANRFESTITWNISQGGGNFSTDVFIGDIQEPSRVTLGDLNGDGNDDILTASTFGNEIIWFENIDGNGNFSSEIILTTSIESPFAIEIGDIDDDGANDILVGTDSSVLLWLRNVDGAGNFEVAQVINNSAPNSRSIAVSDIDGDGDLDLVASSSGAVRTSWYENLDGLGTFGPQQVIIGAGPAVSYVITCDLDGDGDRDVVSSINSTAEIVWNENLDGLGTFGEQTIITSSADGAVSVFCADLDNDGDIDMLSSSLDDDKVAWYENIDGLGDFGPQIIISDNADVPFRAIASDLDNDGDLDVVSASRNDDKLAWYENLTILGIADPDKRELNIYPNPTKGILLLEVPPDVSVLSTSLIDHKGGVVLHFTGDLNEIDISHLAAGMYFLTSKTTTGTLIKKVLKE